MRIEHKNVWFCPFNVYASENILISRLCLWMTFRMATKTPFFIRGWSLTAFRSSFKSFVGFILSSSEINFFTSLKPSRAFHLLWIHWNGKPFQLLIFKLNLINMYEISARVIFQETKITKMFIKVLFCSNREKKNQGI